MKKFILYGIPVGDYRRDQCLQILTPPHPCAILIA